MSELSSPSNLIARRAHRKSKTGCRACKQRKVKCDEARPVCRNCAIHFVNIEKCDYGHAVSRLDEYLATSPPKPKSPAKDVSRKRKAYGELSPKVEEDVFDASLSLRPGSTGLDPFQTYPPTSLDGADSLISHYLTVVVHEAFPFFTRDALINLWWPSIGSDQLLFHTTLLLSSLDLEKRSYRKGVDTGWRLAMRECIKLLRERIDDQMTNQDISDETIVSVAILAAIEHERGDFKSLHLHAEGLRRMINLRGGLDAIRKSHLAAGNMVSWILMVLAIDVSPRHLPTPSCWESSTLYLESTPLPLPEIAESQLPGFFCPTDLEAAGIGLPALPLLLEVRALTTRFTRAVDPSPAREFLAVFSDLCNLMQRIISTVPAPTSTVSPLTDHSSEFLTPTSHATLLALALYILAPLRGMHPDPNILISTLSLRLFSLLSSLLPPLITASTSVSPSPSSLDPDRLTASLLLHFWLTSIGATAVTPQTPEHDWYLSSLVALAGELDIGDWDAYHGALSRITLCDILCQPRLSRLWEEIGRKREALAW